MTPPPATEPAALKLIRDMYAMLGDYLAHRHDPYAELKAAHAAGKEIEILSSNREWHTMTIIPQWNDKPEFYRIKPAPQPAEPPAKWQREKEHFEKGGKIEGRKPTSVVPSIRKWGAVVDPNWFSDWEYRIAPEAPAPQSRRVAWSQPSDVPLNCWVRSIGSKNAAFVIYVTPKGITAYCTTHETLCTSPWSDLDDYEYSTDRINWQPCTREAAPEAS